MPNWKTHIEIGKKLNKYLNYSEDELNLLLFGSILPDINNCYIVEDISQKIGHDITHMGNFRTPTYIDFYNKYINEIKNNNPIFIGYLLHLFTDYKFNDDFYSKKADYQKYDKENLRIIKQSDFGLFNNEFIENAIPLYNFNTTMEEVNKIEEISVTEEDVQKVIEFLHVQKEYKGKMEFYSIGELTELTNNIVTEFCNFIV